MSASTKRVYAFTPGPWKIDRSFPRRLPFGISRADEPSTMVLTTRAFCRMTTDEGEANAHLIAAAPDLLAALRAIVEHGEPIYPADWVRLKEQGAAAVAKAIFCIPDSNRTEEP